MSNKLTGDSTIFLLGAGFSKSIDLDMPLMGELPSRLEFVKMGHVVTFALRLFDKLKYRYYPTT